MTNFEPPNALIFVIVCMITSPLAFYMLKPEPQQPDAPKSNFEVVDTYKGCDVVQYTPDYSARYTYFLDCRK